MQQNLVTIPGTIEQPDDGLGDNDGLFDFLDDESIIYPTQTIKADVQFNPTQDPNILTVNAILEPSERNIQTVEGLLE